MADETGTIELLIAAKYSDEDAAKTAKLLDDYQDKVIRNAMSKQEKADAKVALGRIARVQKDQQVVEDARLKIVEAGLEKEKAAWDKAHKGMVEVPNMIGGKST